ncbi:MAG: 16S rRNA (cytidine(1402)-2'-O)-methyltransferase [Deltaproteobacteria bacterium]
MAPGTLFLVATPLGNLGDVTLRALELLREVPLIVCEDTRRTRTLLSAHGIATRLVSLPAFAEAERTGPLLERLLRGEDLALCTDAGSVAISDPGRLLVERAISAGIRVTSLPGPSAPIAALQLSGLPTDRFLFAGFLPRKGGSRRDALRELASERATLILFESPRRLSETLADLRLALGDRRAAVARELTKLHEEVARGRLSELAERFAGGTLGEVTLVIDGAAGPAAAEGAVAPLDEAIQALASEGLRLRDLARRLSEERGVPAREIYARALEVLGRRG